VTFLIQTEDFNLITDPVFANLLGPFNLMGPNRQREAGMKIEELPPIDIVLVSHNHYDHMDVLSLEEIYKRDRPVFVLPLGNEKYLKGFGKDIQIHELDWFDQNVIKSKKTNLDIKVWLTPAQHWSARGLHDKRDALWGGFVVESNQGRIFFVGDSGYPANENKNIFKEIKNKIGAMDLSFIPIGAYEPRWFMKGAHMNPDEAVLVHQDVESKNSVGMHFGTFRLTDEPYLEPEQNLKAAVQKYRAKNFISLENGQTKKYSSIK
jgi:L-ascorbate metabolism protein UlaG (beta-lactamase superfamily)